MGHKTATERILDLEQAHEELVKKVDGVIDKHKMYDQFFEMKQAQQSKLRKARQKLKKIQDKCKIDRTDRSGKT